jgi:hypothetical protein
MEVKERTPLETDLILDQVIMASKICTGFEKLSCCLLIVISVLVVSTWAMSCNGDKFKIYYIPIDAQFYVPLTPEDIEKNGKQLIISSCEISKLFDVIKKDNFDVPDKDDLSGLRIRIVNMSDGKELYITTEKNLIMENKKYKIDKETIDAALKVIDDFLNLPKEGKQVSSQART